MNSNPRQSAAVAAPTSSTPQIWRCAVPSPLRQLLDYLPAPGAPGKPGCRVRVPLGRRTVVGIIVEITGESALPAQQLRPAEALLDTEPLLSVALLQLLRWVSDYYIHPPGEVLPLGLSPRERRGEPSAPVGVPGLQLTLHGKGLPQGALSRAPQQAKLLAALQQGPASLSQLSELGISQAVIRQLLQKSLAARCDIAPARRWSARQPLAANSEQQAAIDAIALSFGRFACHLLQGITGSGKTEVYLRLCAETIASGHQALVLLPEIALTPQMLERFRERFAAPVVELHSNLGDSVRDRNWACARDGHAAVVIGTRSAVFTPLQNVGLIIVDEEHESSFTQQDGLRYSARDVAIKRGQINDCPVVLGSATPSLETLANVYRQRFQRHQLTARAGVAQLPGRKIIDIRGLALDAGLSTPLIEAMTTTLEAGEQVLLFLNRRGFAPALTCHDCGWVGECRHCDARMTIHRQPPRLQCHHCGAEQFIPATCPDCASRRLLAAGVGTEQTEIALGRHFTQVPIHRVDSDTVRTRSAMSALREALAPGNPALLVGTQMLAKGHDFPHVTLVGVVDADALLFSPDFRGEERLLQLLVQVAGRAGRGERPGQVLIQTRHPEHPLMQGMLTHSYEQQANLLLRDREQRRLPPYGALALLRADSPTRQTGMDFLDEVARQAKQRDLGCSVVGPLGTPMARRAGMHRTQLVIHGGERRIVGAAVRQLAAIADNIKRPARLRWFIDVDPVDAI